MKSSDIFPEVGTDMALRVRSFEKIFDKNSRDWEMSGKYSRYLAAMGII